MRDQFSYISYLMIEVNSACNLKCAFCNREDLVEKGWRAKETLTPNQFRETLSYFKDCSLDTVKLEGISEPMMHPQFDECAEVLREMFPDVFVIVATNLQYNLLKSRFLQTLDHIDMMYLSIDGVGEVYEKARLGSKYSRLLKSLDDIYKNTTQQQRDKLHINFTLTEHNFHTLPEMYKLRDKYKLSSVRINLAQNWNEHEANAHDFHPDLLKSLEPYIDDLKGVPNWDYTDCFWPYEGLIVDVFGNVRQCIINTSQEPIGNIYKDDFRKIFNESMHYRSTRKSLEKSCPTENCKNCDYKHLSKPLAKVFGERAENITPRKFTVA